MGDAKGADERDQRSGIFRTWILRLGVVFAAFLLGIVPMLVYNWQLSSQLATNEQQLRRSRVERSLTAAALYARRGEYETARQNASAFFTEVRVEMDKGDESVFTAEERRSLDSLMVVRDDIITLLSRNDPAAAERLSNLYVDYSSAVPRK